MRTLRILLTSAYVRGILGQIIFTLIGMGFINLIRRGMGL